jgi:hypothetical protein
MDWELTDYIQFPLKIQISLISLITVHANGIWPSKKKNHIFNQVANFYIYKKERCKEAD